MAQYVFAVDLGGTTVKLGLFDSDGNVLDKWEIVTRKEYYKRGYSRCRNRRSGTSGFQGYYLQSRKLRLGCIQCK